MNEMVERCVRVGVKISPEFRSWGVEERLEFIKSIIQAMREPTEKMLHAATMQVPTWDNDASRRKWQAMIDAALGKVVA